MNNLISEVTERVEHILQTLFFFIRFTIDIGQTDYSAASTSIRILTKLNRICLIQIWALSWENLIIRKVQIVQSDQDLCCSLPRQCNISSFYSHNFMLLLWLCRSDCVSPGRKPRRRVFSWQGSYILQTCKKRNSSVIFTPDRLQSWTVDGNRWTRISNSVCLLRYIDKTFFFQQKESVESNDEHKMNFRYVRRCASWNLVVGLQ